MSNNNKPLTGRAEVLSVTRHGALRFHVADNFSFAADWLYVPVHVKEAGRLSQQLPVLFYPLADGRVMPCMLLKSKEKSAINRQMRWHGGALPDLLRLYPFGFRRQQGRSTLTLYPEAPHFIGKGEKIITSKGKPTQRLRSIIKQLAPVEQAFEQTRPIMQELQALNVLRPLAFNLKRGDEAPVRLTLLACPDPEVLRQHELSPALKALLFVHQQSCRHLFLEVKAPPQPPSSEQAAVDDESGETVPAALIDKLIADVCQQFEVSLDDLRSRKRSDAIRLARAELSCRARELGQLDVLAGQLQRSVDTVRKWS